MAINFLNCIRKFSLTRKTVLIIVFIVYLLLTKSSVGSGNEKSRYATIESLVERCTLIIDNSSFLDTNDKVLIKDHFYSDKPIGLSLLASGFYFIIYHVFGLSFSNDLAIVVYLLNIILMVLPTIIMLFFFYRLLDNVNIKEKYQHIVVLTLAFGTFVFPYSLVFNNHIVTANLCLIAFYFMVKMRDKELPNWNYYVIGLLLGSAFSFDIVVGGVFLIIFSLGTIIDEMKKRRIKNLIFFGLGAILPIIILLGVNYYLAGDFLPMTMHPEFWNYPGSDFSEENLTGVTSHTSFSSIMTYAFHSLLGYRGLFSYTPILLISLYYLIRVCTNTKHKFFKEGFMILTGIIITVLFYIVSSNNYGGYNYGMRWFVGLTPLLFFFCALLFRKKPSRIMTNIYYILAFISLFIALVGVYNPWADCWGYKIFFYQPIPFLNNLRFLVEDLIKILFPTGLDTIKNLVS